MGMSNSNRVSKRVKLIGFTVFGVVILLAIVFSLGTRRVEGVSTPENPDRAGHPIYSKYHFDRSGRIINFMISKALLSKRINTANLFQPEILSEIKN